MGLNNQVMTRSLKITTATLLAGLSLTALVGCSANNNASNASTASPGPSVTASTDTSGKFNASYTAKPLSTVSPGEQTTLATMENNTKDTLNDLLSIAAKPNSPLSFMSELDATKDPEVARNIIAKYSTSIDEVSKLMSFTPEKLDLTPLEIRGIDDPEMSKKIITATQYVVFANTLKPAVAGSKVFTIDIVPGTFRTEAGKTVIPRGSVYVKDDNGGIIDFIETKGTIVLENQGKMFNFDDYSKPSGINQETVGDTWVTDYALYQEFSSLKYKYKELAEKKKFDEEEANHFASYLNQNFKYGGTFKDVTIGKIHYIQMDHPASILEHYGPVLYRFDEPSQKG